MPVGVAGKGDSGMSRAIVSRRAILGTTAAAGLGLVAGCSSGENGSRKTQSSNSFSTLPKHIPLAGAKPDLPATDDGVLAGYLQYPPEPVSVVSGTPGSGGTVSILSQSAGAYATIDRNLIWQEVNKALGATLEFTAVPPATYSTKFATTVAGGDLPDMIEIPTEPVRDLPTLLAQTCQDLTDHLTADAISEHPCLANLPQYVWRNTIFGGRIRALPVMRGIAGNVLFARQDIADQLGLSMTANSGEEFLELCRSFTDNSKNRWAVTQHPSFMLSFMMECVGAPNEWEEKNGKFTSAYESDKTKRALEIVASMWKENLFHPDSFAGADAKAWIQGRSLFVLGSYAQWPRYLTVELASNPQARVSVIAPPDFDGNGAGVKHLHKGVFTVSALRKTDDKRAKELLRIANWMAAPFGTREHLLRRYGIERKTYTHVESGPKLNEQGTAQFSMPDTYIMTPPSVLYTAGNPDSTREQHEYQTKVVPTGIQSAAIGLYSATDSRDGARLSKKMVDTQADIIQGRKPVSAWDDAVASWRREGGDRIRAEYADAFETANR